MRTLSLMAAASILGACAGHRDVLPEPVAVGEAAVTNSQCVVMRTKDAGELRTILGVELEPSGRLHAKSREGAVTDVVGWWRGTLARTFTGNFPGGALVSLEASAVGAPANGQVPLKGVWSTPVGRFVFTGRLEEGKLSGELRSRQSMFGDVAPLQQDVARPLDDYPLIVQRAKAAATSRIYDPRTQATTDWQDFWAEVARRAGSAQDDLDMVFGFFDAASKLDVSHVALLRNPAQAEAAVAGNEPPVRLSVAAPGVALVRVEHFQAVTAVIDDAFRSLPEGTRTLILDLRGCPGGDLSSMRVASHLFNEPADAGFFVGATWWRNHEALPTPSERAALPRLQGGGRDALVKAIADDGAVSGWVQPVAPLFSGQVLVLVDGGTASAAEPLAALLHETGRATLVGETTAGAMLSSEMADLGGGWVLRLPTADYFTAAGVRLENRGVKPDRGVSSSKALEAALQLAR